MNQENKDSIAWQYTKGMALSYAALATSLIKSGTIRSEDLIKELDSYIDIFTKLHPDAVAMIETMKLVKDILLQLYKNNPSSDPPVKWLNDFVGNA